MRGLSLKLSFTNAFSWVKKVCSSSLILTSNFYLGVGKSTLVHQLVGTYTKNKNKRTPFGQFYSKEFNINDKNIKLQISDTVNKLLFRVF